MSDRQAGQSWLPSNVAATIPAAPIPLGTILTIAFPSLCIFLLAGYLLKTAPQQNYPSLHSALDAGCAVIAGLTAVTLLARIQRQQPGLVDLIGFTFIAVAVLDTIHMVSGLEGVGELAHVARPATWGPSAYVLAGGICIGLVERLLARRVSTRRFAVMLGGSSLALLALFTLIPSYQPPGWLGITRPSLIGVFLFWLVVLGIAGSRFNRKRLNPGLVLLSGFLLAGSGMMLYSTSPHDPPAMLAHVGKLLGYIEMQAFVALLGAMDGSALARSVEALARSESALRESEARLLHDLAERQAGAEALQAAERYARDVIDLSYDAFIAVDGTGAIQGWNRQAERLFGWTRDEVVGQALDQTIIPERFREQHRQGMARYLATGQNRVIGKVLQLSAIRRDGTEFPVELTIAPVTTQQGTVFTAFLRDITERVRAETLRQRHAASLETANAELDAFAHSVSHDLRAPLRSIDGFSQILQEDHSGQLDVAGNDALRRIRSAAERMGHLIDDLLKLSKVSRGELHLTTVNLSVLAELILRDLRDHAPGRVVETRIGPELSVEGDPRLLRIALENLLGNAWKYTSKHPAACIEFGATSENGGRVFFVKDDGAGFDMAYAGQLFGAFQRFHKTTEFEGTGVGLATVQRIIHRHGGRIWAEAEVERGATFFFTL